MTKTLEAAVAHPDASGWAPTADESCPWCGAATEPRYADAFGVLPAIEAEVCTCCAWAVEFDPTDTDGGEDR